jgi:hypothetical protein
MKQKRIARYGYAGLILALVAMLVGCKSSQPATAVSNGGIGSTYTSPTLTTSYPGALNASSQLMLGTLRLEGTENAVTPEQAAALLPVAQALQGRVLQSDAERDAALAYVEAHLTPAQLAAIVGMHLTQDELAAWTRDNDRGAGTGPGQGGAGVRGTPGAPAASGGAFPGGRGTPPAMGTRQAQFGRGTPQAGGAVRGTSSGAATGSGQDTILLNALIRLLAQKAAVSAAPSLGNRTSTRTPVSTSVLSPTATLGPASTSFPLPTPTKP